MRRTRLRHVAIASAVGVILLSLAACSSDNTGTEEQGMSSMSPAAEETAPPEATTKKTEVSKPSRTADEQPVSEALMQRFISFADDAGYGPADEGFALLMVDVCRDIESGHSRWSELISQDVADGASRRDATLFHNFLRDEYCPGVRPVADRKQPKGDPDAVSNGTRGLASSAAYLDAHWEHGSLEACRAATGAPLGEARAYVQAGGLVCADYVDAVWGDALIDLDVVFEPPVSEADARAAALTLLPLDAEYQVRVPHNNPNWASEAGSCISLVFGSSTLDEAVRSINADWSDANEATATLYSEKQTNYGSGNIFDGTVRLMSLSLGGTSADASC